MKSTFTKKALFLLALLTAAGCISCGENAKNPDDTKEQKGDVSETVTETSEPAYEPPVADLNKYSFRIVATDDPARTQQNAYHEEMEGEPVNDAIHMRNVEVEDRLNVNLEWILYDNNEDNYMRELIVQSVNAGDDDYDMVIGSPWFVVMRCDYRQVYLDLCELEGLSLTESWWSPKAYENLRVNGKLYFTVCPISPMFYAVPYAVLFDKTQMNTFDLGNPYDWVKDGTWTFDKMFDTAKKFSYDENGDGKLSFDDERVGFSGNNGEFYSVAANIKQIVSLDNSYINNLTDEKLVSFSQKVGAFIKEQNVTGTASKGFIEGRVLFWTTTLRSCWDSSLRDSDYELGILPPPKYDEAQEAYHSAASANPAGGVCVPVTIKDYARNGTIMENMAFYSEKYIRPATHDVLILGKNAHDAESIEMLELIYNSVDYDINAFLNIANTCNTMNDCFAGKLELATQYAKMRSSLEKALEDLFVD